MTVSAKMNAVVLAAKGAVAGAGENKNLAVAFTMQAVARKATELYGCDKDGILELARDVSTYLWDTEKMGNQKGFFFENVLKDFYKENNQKAVSNVVLDMYKQVTLHVAYN